MRAVRSADRRLKTMRDDIDNEDFEEDEQREDVRYLEFVERQRELLKRPKRGPVFRSAKRDRGGDDDDDEEEGRKDLRFREFIEHQREQRGRRKYGPRYRAVETDADPEAIKAQALRIRRVVYYVLLYVVCVAALAVAAAWFWFGESQVPAQEQDPFQVEAARLGGWPLEITNSIGMRFRFIPPGAFDMGSPRDEPGHTYFEYKHRIEVPHPYYVAVTETTQKQYEQIMGSNPSFFAVSTVVVSSPGSISGAAMVSFMRRKFNVTAEGTMEDSQRSITLLLPPCHQPHSF